MAQQQETPIYWDQHATKWNLTLIFSLVVLVLGFFAGYLLVVLGLVMAAYSWLTTPRQFLLYRDSMVIVYGMPRTRHISYAEISHVELLALPFGERLRIRMMSGSRMMLMMRDPGAFRAHLEDALAQYHGEQSGASYVAGTLVDRQPDTEFDSLDDDDSAVDQVESEIEAEAGVIADDDFRAEPEPSTDSPGSYAEEPAEQAPDESDESEVYTGRVEQAASVSGSYTETPEPDFSGEGRPAYGADVELETTSSEEDDPKRPPSPY